MADEPTVVRDAFDGLETIPEVKDDLQVEKGIEENKGADGKENLDKTIKDEKDNKDSIVDDGRNYLKERLGFDDWDTAKKEYETLKTKAQTPAQIKYENEISEKVHKAVLAGKTDELREYLDAQAKLNRLTGEITKDNAPDIVKAYMAEKYKGLSQEQINYKFNKQFGVPKEPIRTEDELEDEFEERKSQWEEKVKDAEVELMIEANVAQPELSKLKSELKFPDIPQTQSVESEPTPEELAEAKANMESFVKSAEEAVKEFEGFNAEYKDKDVDIKSAYSLSDEEKSVVVGVLKTLAENSYNSNALFAERWVNDDMTFNFKQMVKDIATLETSDRSAQKFIGDAAAKAKKQFIKEKKNIDLNTGAGDSDIKLEDKTFQEKNEEAIWN